MKKLILTATIGLFMGTMSLHAQSTDIIQLMQRRDIKLSQIDSIAQLHFNIVGTGKGTGYNQYQRWYYEQRFHLTADGYILPPEDEYNAFEQAMRTMTPTSTMAIWVEKGPRSWNRTSGWNPGVGRITCIGIAPVDTTVIYIGSPGGGLWKSENSGVTWTPLSDNAANRLTVNAVTVDPTNVDIVYLSASGVFKSYDGGASWVTMGGIAGTVRKFVVQPGNSNIVFAASTGGIYRSVNAGVNWTQVSNVSTEDIEFKTDDVNTMFASGNGVMRSVDNGVSWTTLTSGNGITNSGRTLVSVSAANPNIVYAVQASGSLFGRLYRSTDGGLSFVTQIVGNPASGTNFFGYDANGTGTTGQATYDMAMCVSPYNADELYIAGIICFKSINGGTSFTAITEWSLPNSTGYNHADVHTLNWVNNTIYSSSDGGIYKSIDKGDNWLDLSTGLGIRQFYRLDCSQTNPDWFGGGAQDNGSSINKVPGWIDWLGADGMEMEFSYTNANVVYGTSQNGQLYRSVNGGSSYSSLPRPSAGQWVTPFAVHPTNDSIVFGGWTGVYKTVNRGNTWTNISAGVITTTLACLTISLRNPDFIYASDGTNLYVTGNGGASWTRKTAPAAITSICVSTGDPTKLWITCSGTTNRVYVSSDSGTVFTSIAGTLPTVAARSIVVDRDDPNEGLYIGMNTGVYYRDNTMSDWVPYLLGLPLVAINELDIQQSARKVRVATYGRGIWETDLFASNPIPVRWLSFTVTRQRNAHMLQWKAQENSLTKQYTAEYSSDGIHYTPLSTVTAQVRQQGLSSFTGSYQLPDPAHMGRDAYYRIRQQDVDGRINYSDVVFIKGEDHPGLVLYPNPVNDRLQISIPGISGNAILQIYNTIGIRLLQQTVSASTATLDLSAYSRGQYVLRVTKGDKVYQGVFVKQ